MNEDAPAGLVISALGAAVLAISVFLPWYGVNISASGAAAVEQKAAALSQEYGDSSLQDRLQQFEWQHGSLVGYQLGTVSAHRTLKFTSAILLLLAGIALLASLLRLADMRGFWYATGGQIALFGALAGLLVLSRMVFQPGGPDTFISLSLNPGIWLALLSGAGIFAGGLIAGSAPSRVRRIPKHGPGPPPINRDIASPLSMFRDQQP